MNFLGAAGVPIARLFGIEIRVHVSWVLILSFVTVGVANQLAAAHPAWDDLLRWVIAAIVSVCFFGSVLLHELGHGLAARRRGLTGGSVTLLFFGGTTSLGQDARRPADEAVIAAAGPVVSLVLGVVAIAVWQAAGQFDGQAAEAVSDVAFVLAVLNVLLGLINLLPVFPLDGGRVLRAIAWQVTGDERRASRIVALISRSGGWALIAAGVAVIVVGDTIDGLMLGVSGWFLTNASRALERRAALEDLLRGLRVESAMERDLPGVSPQLTLDTFAAQYLLTGEGTSLPVLRGEELLGLIGISQLRRIRRAEWPRMRAADVMVSPPALPSLRPEEALWAGLERLRSTGLDGLPVMRDSELLGVLTRRSVVSAIQGRVGLVPKGAGPTGG